MGGIERMTRRVCEQMQNPDKFIEKSAIKAEKLGWEADPQKIEKAQRLLSQAQSGYSRAEIQMQMQKQLDRLK